MNAREAFSVGPKEVNTKEGAAPWRLLPSSFDPLDEHMGTIAQPLDWRWSSAEEAIRREHCQGVMMRLPLFWQMEIPLFKACRGAGAYILINDQDNLPLGASAIREAGVDCVLTERDDALRFASYLTDTTSAFPRSWIIIHRADAVEWELPALLQHAPAVSAEVHLFPGVPVLEQCRTLAQHKKPHFHAVNSWIPFTASELPWKLEVLGMCECGKETLKRN